MKNEEKTLEYERENLRRWTAVRIAAKTGLKFEEILKILQDMGVHGNWTMEEIYHRPVDINELIELVEERINE